MSASATAAANLIIDERIAKGNIWRLSAAQALAGANSIVVMTTGGIAGATLAPNIALATVPVSCFVVGTAVATMPAGYLAYKYGRKIGFYLGCLSGLVCGLLAALAIYIGSFALFCLATFIGGFYQAVAHSFRFAATDGASPRLRPKAISWVMAGGVFSAFLGPQLVNLTMNFYAPYLFMVSFIVQGGVALINMAVLSGTILPKPAAADLRAGRPLMEIARQPAFITAAICGIVSYALMNLLMTSAPLAMKMCGLSLSDANLGIQWHVLGMFGPSFFTGNMIARFGAPRIVLAGLAMISLAAIIGLMGITVWHFWIGLAILGIGWNFGFIGASAMVVATHRPEERNKVQSFNDFLVFGVMAVMSFASGGMLAWSGWDLVNWFAFGPIAIALVVLVMSGQLVAKGVGSRQ